MITIPNLFFLSPHDKIQLWSQNMYFTKVFRPFSILDIFLSIFEKTKYFLKQKSLNI